MSRVIVDTNNANYKSLYDNLGDNSKHNGLYYYAKTIEKYIIPNVQTDRPWNTIGLQPCGGEDRMIVFVHNNLTTDKSYMWLNRFQDVVCVSNVRKSADSVLQYGHSIYLPPSVNVEEVKALAKGIRKNQDACFAGNPWPAYREEIDKYVPPEVHRFGTMPREKFLPIVAHYRKCYAIGCTAVEARALGCEILKRSDTYDPDDFPLLDTADAAKCLQEALAIIDNQKVNQVIDCTKLKSFIDRKIK